MKTMKNGILFLLVCLMLLSASLPVFADVIIEPQNDFFEKHRSECTYQGYRQYTVNSERGHAYPYVSPESSVTSTKGYQNGKKVAIHWLYTDSKGEVWGILTNEAGWFRMSELTLVYDSLAFLEEHEDEMTIYTEGSYDLAFTEEKPAVMWDYPGKKSDATLTADLKDHISKAYTDENGIVWGYISYYCGMRNVWICLSDPYGTEAEQMTEKETAIVLKAEPTPADQIPMSAENQKILFLIGGLVGGLILGMVIVIIAVFVIQNKKKAAKQ